MQLGHNTMSSLPSGKGIIVHVLGMGLHKEVIVCNHALDRVLQSLVNGEDICHQTYS